MMKYQRGLASMVYEFFDKKNLTATHAWSETLATRNKLAGTGIRNQNVSNQELAQVLYKPLIKNFLNKLKYTHLLQTIFRVLTLLICE